MRKYENSCPKVIFADRAFRLVCNSMHNSLQAYVTLRRYTAATSIPPTWRYDVTVAPCILLRLYNNYSSQMTCVKYPWYMLKFTHITTGVNDSCAILHQRNWFFQITDTTLFSVNSFSASRTDVNGIYRIAKLCPTSQIIWSKV